uniref:Uncharacterized protein n=1 Tax=Mimiviridae sp. ChoanoV1 TaxID=2596887 RepID=A0A5B8HWQ5_9VIRU|nr:hypothetical protein 5_20 [Mimiviridae sp. ChoanoV1]
MNHLILVVILIILFLYFQSKEHFISDNNEISNIKNTLINLWGGILNVNDDLKIKKFKNSSKYSISNAVRLIPINSYILSYKMNISKENRINKINYDYNLNENINNQPTGILIGNNYTTDKKNKSYGFVITYNPDILKHNYAYLGIDYNKKEIKNKNKIDNTLNRRVVEVFTKDYVPGILQSYFKEEEENKCIGIFDLQNNIEFIKSLEKGSFNLVDLYNNTIVSNCKITKPYCNVELPVKGNTQGRNSYIVSKYSAENKKPLALKSGNDLLTYQNERECKNDRNIHKKMLKEGKNIEVLDLDNYLIKNDKEILNTFIEKTGLKCRKHNSEFDDKYFYGGIDNDDKMKCHSQNMECIYYNNQADCQKETEKLDSFNLFDLDPLDSQDPTYVGEEKLERYKDYKDLNCIKTNEDEVVCKHIYDKVLSDILTFNIDKCLEKDAKKILDNRKVLELRKTGGVKDDTPDSEYLKNKYFIEPYSNNNPMIYIQEISYYLKLKNTINNGIITVCEIIKLSKDKTEISLGYLEYQGNVYELKPGNKIYTYINQENKMFFCILDTDDSILISYMCPEKFKGNYGSNINFYLATNNTNIFEDPNYTANCTNVVIPYISSVNVNISN